MRLATRCLVRKPRRKSLQKGVLFEIMNFIFETHALRERFDLNELLSILIFIVLSVAPADFCSRVLHFHDPS